MSRDPTQSVVLWTYRRNERRRIDPELLRQCAAFSVAVDRLKRELHFGTADRPELTKHLDALDAAAASLTIIGSDDIQQVVDEIVGDIASVLFAERRGDDAERDEALTRVFEKQMEFTQVVRKYFGQLPRLHRAVPMIDR
jgi:hypothetical protein